MNFDAFINHIYFKRVVAAGIDFSIEVFGSLLGGYFGAMVAALVIVLKETNPMLTQKAIWTGMVAGFFFWGVAVSWVNRVLIQGLSRASIGKKLMQLEVISKGEPIDWKMMMKHWLTAGLAGELAVISILDAENLAPVIPLRPKTVEEKANEKKAA